MMAKWFFILTNLLICLDFSLSADDEILQWYKDLSDPAKECFECDYKNEGISKIFEVAQSCKDVGARWDYNFKSKDKNRKAKGTFQGVGELTFAQKNREDQRFKFGFRHNKCLGLHDDSVSRIQGKFQDDALSGRVRIDYHHGGFGIATVNDNKFVGIFRRFDRSGALQNVEIFDDRNLKWSTAKNGLLRLTSKNSRMSNRAYFIRNTHVIYSCKEEEKFLLRDCYQVQGLQIQVAEGCGIDVQDEKVSELDPHAPHFSWHLVQDVKSDPKDHPECSEQWTEVNVPDIMKSWMKEITDATDPFWYEEIPSGDAESLEVQFPEYFDRFIVSSNTNVNVSMVSEVAEFVGSTGWNDGDIYFKIPEDVKDDYSRLTRIKVYANFQGLQIDMGSNNADVILGALLRFKNGKMHGIVRRYGIAVADPRHLCGNTLFKGLSFVGRYENGIPVGKVWRGVVGNAYIYGSVDDKGQLSGDDIAYIYPDFKTAMIGTFRNGVMVEGRAAEVIATRCVNGMREVKLSEPTGPTFKHELPTKNSYGGQPLLTDPLDDRYVEIRSSTVDHEVADEGAFAKVDIPAGEAVATYSGFALTKKEHENLNNELKQQLKHLDPNDPMHWIVTKYHGSVSECKFNLAIPYEQGSLDIFRSALGYKFNHSFKPNCKYAGILDTPRFGITRAFVTIKPVKKGEELFINYGYPIELGPPWYKELYRKSQGSLPSK